MSKSAWTTNADGERAMRVVPVSGASAAESDALPVRQSGSNPAQGRAGKTMIIRITATTPPDTTSEEALLLAATALDNAGFTSQIATITPNETEDGPPRRPRHAIHTRPPTLKETR